MTAINTTNSCGKNVSYQAEEFRGICTVTAEILVEDIIITQQGEEFEGIAQTATN